jgi:hypothetical protein
MSIELMIDPHEERFLRFDQDTSKPVSVIQQFHDCFGPGFYEKGLGGDGHMYHSTILFDASLYKVVKLETEWDNHERCWGHSIRTESGLLASQIYNLMRASDEDLPRAILLAKEFLEDEDDKLDQIAVEAVFRWRMSGVLVSLAP